MKSHTRGPWSQDNRFIYAPADAGLPDRYNGGACLVLAKLHGAATDEDARLIAAAPTLLEACEQAEHWLANDDGSAEPAEMLRVLRAALAAAGRAP